MAKSVTTAARAVLEAPKTMQEGYLAEALSHLDAAHSIVRLLISDYDDGEVDDSAPSFRLPAAVLVDVLQGVKHLLAESAESGYSALEHLRKAGNK